MFSDASIASYIQRTCVCRHVGYAPLIRTHTRISVNPASLQLAAQHIYMSPSMTIKTTFKQTFRFWKNSNHSFSLRYTLIFYVYVNVHI